MSRRGRTAVGFLVFASVLVMDATDERSIGPASASSPAGYLQPYVWGGVVSGASPWGQWPALVTGTTALSSSAPAGGGSLDSREDEGGPIGKLRSLVAFNGGTPLFFGEGGSGSTAGAHVMVAVRNSDNKHEVWGWGANSYGQLGDGTTTIAYSPVKATWTAGTNEQIQEIAIGERHTLMRTSDGTTTKVYAWGSNGVGQVGGVGMSVASSAKQLVPFELTPLRTENIVSIAAGRFHSVAADAGGSVWVWGYDSETGYGNIGLPGSASRFLPEKLTSVSVDKKLATITGYSITNNVATVTTSNYHYFEKGDDAVVSTGIPVLDGLKDVTAVSNNGFSFVAQESVASTADTDGTVTFNSPEATVTAKSISANVASLTVGAGHNYRVGNVVDVAIGDPAFDGIRSVTNVSSAVVSFQSQPNVGSQSASGSLTYVTPSAAVTQKRIAANVATLWVPGNNFITGNRVLVSIGDPAFDGERVIASSASGQITFTSRANLASTAVSPSGTASLTAPLAAAVTNRVMTAPSGGLSTATLTVPVNHNFKVGNIITVDITGASEASFDGTHAITAVGTTSVSYRVSGVASAIATGSTTGSITMANSSLSVTNKSITGNKARITVGASHGWVAGNMISVTGVGDEFDGSRVIDLVGADWVEFVSQPDIAAVATTGTVTQKDLTIAISAASIASNVVTATVPSGHDLETGNVLTVNTGLGGNFDGTKTITGVSASTITYIAQADMTSTPAAGSVDMNTPFFATVSKSIDAANLATVNVGSGHTFEIGNSVTVAGLGGNFDGTKTITGVAASTISFTAQANVGSVTMSGTAEVDTCTSSCPLVPSGVVEVAAGWGFTMARTSSQVLTWGFYGTATTHYGRLGRSNPTVTTPFAVTLPGGCVPSAITAAPYNGAVTCANNSVVTWGYNGNGNTGRNIAVTTTTVSTTGAVSGITLNSGESIASVEMNHYGGIALTSQGRMYTWGGNAYRLLGTANPGSGATVRSLVATLTTRIVPSGGASVTKIFSDFYNSAVLDSNGKVWSWGTAAMGVSGRGTAGPVDAVNGNRFYPIGIDPAARVEFIESTYFGTVVVMSDSTVWTLGTRASGSGYYFHGDGTTDDRFMPGRIDLPFGPDTSVSATISQLSCSTYHCLLATSNGSIYGWGDGTLRSLVVNTTTDRSTPVLIKSGLVNPRIATGHGVSFYVDIGAGRTGGVVYAWGDNRNRRAVPQSGTTPLNAFTAVSDTIAPAVNNNIIDISAGSVHAIALRADGTLMMWGHNGYGQLATGNTSTGTYFSEPVIPGGRVAASLHAAGNFTIVRATDGTLWGWGTNASNILALSGPTSVTTVTAVASAYKFKTIDVFGYWTEVHLNSAVGLTTTGTVLTWGSNQHGQLGRSDRPAASSGANAASATPVSVRTSSGGNPTYVDRVYAGGRWSAAWTLASSGTAPGAPTSFLLTSTGPGSLTASWVAPSTPPIVTGYVVEVSRGGVVVFRGGAGAGSTSATFTAPAVDITNGQTHTAVVYAVNDFGQSAASNQSSATPVGAPSVPRDFAVQPIAGGLRASWQTPSDLAGLPVDNYIVTATPTAGGSAVDFTYTVNTSESTTYSREITTLTLGDTYSLTVKAVNTVGPGPSASAVSAVPGRPSAPREVEAIGQPTSADVTWEAPESDGGAAIQSYVVRAYTTGTSSVVSSVITTTRAATLTGLTAATTYDVTVTASQAANGLSLLGSPSDIVKVVPGRPAAPSNPTAVASGFPAGGKVTVTWDKVADLAGITVGAYEIRHVTGVTTTNVAVATSACSATTCTHQLSSLTNGASYSISVRARSTASTTAWGLYSSTVSATPIGATSAPAVDATRSDGRIDATIAEPTSLNGSAVTSYTVSIALTSGGPVLETKTLDPDDPNTFFEGLTNGTSYTISATATNGAGESAAGTDSATPATSSTEPRNVRARPGSIIVTWDAPSSTGGAPIVDYRIVAVSEDGVESTYLASSATNTDNATSGCSVAGRTCTILKVITAESEGAYTSIPPDVTYTISVIAINDTGESPPSDATVMVSAQPDAPTTFVATGATRAIDLCWTAPAGVITAYRVSANFGLQSAVSTVATPLVNPTGCTAPKVGLRIENWDDGSPVSIGVLHTLRVQATVSPSDYIFGIQSDAATATPYDVPLAPSISGATSTASTATISWSPAANRGSSITAYTVTAQPSGDTCGWSSGPLECTLTGLTGNATYSVTVTATNDAGTGAASAPYSLFVDATPTVPTWGSPRMGPAERNASTATFDEQIRYTLTFDEVVSGFSASLLRNAGNAPGCVFGTSPIVANRQFTVTVTCSGEGTLVAELPASSITDSSGNPGPLLDVSAAQVVLSDPITTTTTSTTTSTTVVETSTTVAETTTTVKAPPSKLAAPDPGPGEGVTTTTTAVESTTTSSAPSSPTSSKRPKGSTTTTIGESSGLPPAVDKRLTEDPELVTGIDDGAPVDVGETIAIERCGFDDGEVVRLYVAGNLVAVATADEEGCIEEEVTVPDAAGKKIVVAVYAPSSKRGAKMTLEVAATLAATGSDIDDFVAFGFVSLFVGALLAAVPRRRRRS